MDCEDYRVGAGGFWYRAKFGMVDVLLRKACQEIPCCKGIAKGAACRILNVGVGVGYDLEVISRYGDIYAVDVNKKALQLVPARLCKEKRVADVKKLPYKDGFFDVVVAFDVLEHINDDRAAIAEIRRVLKQGGAFVFSVPAYQSLFSSHDRALGHRRRYARRVLRQRLGQFGSVRLRYWNSFLFPPLALMRVLRRKSPPQMDSDRLPRIFDSLFYVLLSIENLLLRIGIPLPFGLSIVGIARKT
jgi:SAM-dependent methyltransferase